mgnify:CR=1 FL=1
MIRTFPECFDRFLNLGIIPSNSAKSRNNSNYAEILCASNLQNGHAISRILTTPTYRIDLSIPKYHPGAHRAPQRNPISIFPSPSSPPYHPITLTPSPGAEPWSAPGRVNICFIFWREHCRFPHILRRNRWRTLEQDSRLGDPFQGAVTGFGSRLEHQPMDIKRGPWSISKTLEKYYVIPPACASGLVRQAVRFSVNRHNHCASNLQNGHAISRILTTPTYRIDLSIPKYHPGAHRAPQRNPISIFPSPSSPPYHPITLTPSPGAEPWSAPGRVNICFIFWREHCRFPHILRRNRWRTLEQDSRLGDPFQGAVTGFGSRLEHQPMDIKRGPWSISKTLEKYYVIPPACASGLVRQAVRFSVNRHIVGPGKA